MELFSPDKQNCSRDGLCISACPARLIVPDSTGFPRPIDGADQFCISCGHCVAVCPTGSLHHRDIPLAHCSSLTKENSCRPEQVEQLLKGRRSIRNYKKKEVSQEVLARLLTTAGYAPSGHNSQGVSWLVLSNRKELDRFSAIVIDWMHFMVKMMPELARTMEMERTITRWEQGDKVILRGAPVVVVAHGPKDDIRAQSSCTIALTYLELAAYGFGLGACWAGYFNAAATMYPAMKEALALPANNISYGAMMLGYPGIRFQRVPVRKEPEVVWR